MGQTCQGYLISKPSEPYSRRVRRGFSEALIAEYNGTVRKSATHYSAISSALPIVASAVHSPIVDGRSSVTVDSRRGSLVYPVPPRTTRRKVRDHPAPATTTARHPPSRMMVCPVLEDGHVVDGRQRAPDSSVAACAIGMPPPGCRQSPFRLFRSGRTPSSRSAPCRFTISSAMTTRPHQRSSRPCTLVHRSEHVAPAPSQSSETLRRAGRAIASLSSFFDAKTGSPRSTRNAVMPFSPPRTALATRCQTCLVHLVITARHEHHVSPPLGGHRHPNAADPELAYESDTRRRTLFAEEIVGFCSSGT